MDLLFLGIAIIIIILVYVFYVRGKQLLSQLRQGKSPAFIIFLLLSLGILLLFIPYLFSHHSLIGIDTTAGTIGDAVNGMTAPFITTAGVVLTFYAFWIQYQANIQQTNQFKRQDRASRIERLENNFFELVKFHRDNVSEMTFTYHERKSNHPKITKEYTAVGRKIFKIIFYQFIELYNETYHLFKNATLTEIYLRDYQKDLSRNSTVIKRNIDLKSIAIIDVLYLIMFFGLSKNGYKTISRFLAKRYEATFYEPILLWASLKPKEESDYWNEWEKINDSKSQIYINSILEKLIKLKKDNSFTCDNYFAKDYDKFYGGHQFRLGHYYRHFFQTVSFIHNERELLYHVEKKQYLRILRGQLSTYEQYCLVLNSLSCLGRIWELEDLKESSRAIDQKDQLITRYEFIRNISYDELMDNINVSSFYPDVDYESFRIDENISDLRNKLEQVFKDDDPKDHDD